MREPILQSPLHSFDLSSQARTPDESCGAWANEIPLLGYVSLRGDARDPGFAEATTSALGASLPTEPCSYIIHGGRKVLWLSPDEWMVVMARNAVGPLIANLEVGLDGVRRQLADNSGGYTQVLLQGRNALDILQHASVYDFAALLPGRVVGTTFGKTSLYVHRTGDGFCLLMRRSFADYIWRYLVRCAAPYGLGIAAVDAAGHAGLGVAA